MGACGEGQDCHTGLQGLLKPLGQGECDDDHIEDDQHYDDDDSMTFK